MPKTKFLLIACILTILIAAGCGVKSNKLEVINNPNNPDVEEVQLRLVGAVDLQDKIEEITSWIVADEKVYFCSLSQKIVTILDFSGNIIKKLDSVGRGPGEFLMPLVIIDDERNSRIEVADNLLRRNSYFTYNGEYIEDEMLSNDPIYVPQDRIVFGEFDVEYIFGMNIMTDKIVMSPTIQIVKPDTTIILMIRDVELNIAQMDPSQFAYIFTCSDEDVYISTASTDHYKIDVFNTEGKKVKEIRKQFSRIKKSPEDIAKMKEQMAEYEKLSKDLGSDVKYDLSQFEYLEAISQMLVDNEGNLWIATYDTEGNPYYDILNPKGKIIKKCAKSKDAIGMRFYNDKLIEIIKNPDDSYAMNVYEIK